MVKEAIILAGGLGTRLKGVISDIPKPMALVSGKPFLEYLIAQLTEQGISRIILSVGYKFHLIQDYFGSKFNKAEIIYAIEDEPLGTGGAIGLALKKLKGNSVFILNGDSFIDLNLYDFFESCRKNQSDFGMVLKNMENFDRYGTVDLEENRVLHFNEKKAVERGLINCGVYYLNKQFISKFNFPEKYSFEKEFLEKYINDYHFTGFISPGYFIDIGIPQDYAKAQIELPFQFKNLL